MEDDVSRELRKAGRVDGVRFTANDVIGRGRRRRSTRVGALSLALVAVLAVVATGTIITTRDDQISVLTEDDEGPTSNTADPISTPTRVLLQQGPDGPLSPRDQAAVVWTGDSLFVWGGEAGDQALQDGAILRRERWQEVAVSPLPGGPAVAAWTGEEVVVIAAQGEQATTAAYDPTTDTWRGADPLPAAGVNDLLLAGAGGTVIAADTVTNRAWKFTGDRWEPVDALSLGVPAAALVPSGTGFVAVGWNAGEAARASSLDASTGEWTMPVEAPFAADVYGVVVAADGVLLVAADRTERAAILGPGAQTWEAVQGPILDGCDSPPELVTMGESGRVLAASYCGGVSLLSAGEWQSLGGLDQNRLPPATLLVGATDEVAFSWSSDCCGQASSTLTQFLRLE